MGRGVLVWGVFCARLKQMFKQWIEIFHRDTSHLGDFEVVKRRRKEIP